MAKLPTAAMSLAKFNARTLKNWIAKRIRFEGRADLKMARVLANANLTIAQRINIAGQLLRDAVVINLSRPVRKIKKTRVVSKLDPVTAQIVNVRETVTVVDPNSRSKPGEFPRADTTALMKNVFHRHYAEQATSHIGTTLKYGAILELRMNRSYLRRTLHEQRHRLRLIIKGTQFWG